MNDKTKRFAVEAQDHSCWKFKKKKLIISFAIAYVDSRINGAKFSIEISFLIDKNL